MNPAPPAARRDQHRPWHAISRRNGPPSGKPTPQQRRSRRHPTPPPTPHNSPSNPLSRPNRGRQPHERQTGLPASPSPPRSTSPPREITSRLHVHANIHLTLLRRRRRPAYQNPRHRRIAPRPSGQTLTQTPSTGFWRYILRAQARAVHRLVHHLPQEGRRWHVSR